MIDKLTEFFTRHHASPEGLSRLAAASWAAASQAAAAVAKAEDADASWASWAEAREAQARWIRDNFSLTDLNIN